MIKSLLDEWYEGHAWSIFSRRLKLCYESAKSLKVPFPKIRVRKMSKRWGSCGKSGDILLNIELVKNRVAWCGLGSMAWWPGVKATLYTLLTGRNVKHRAGAVNCSFVTFWVKTFAERVKVSAHHIYLRQCESSSSTGFNNFLSEIIHSSELSDA